MNSKPQSQTAGLLQLSRRETRIKKLIDKQSGHQALVALNVDGHVKFFSAKDIAGQIKKVRHCNPCKVEKAGVWWCETDTSAKRLKDRIDVLLKETYTPSPGAGFYQMTMPKQMAQMAVELAAGPLGVVIFSNEEREIWLYDQVKIQSAKAPRGF